MATPVRPAPPAQRRAAAGTKRGRRFALPSMAAWERTAWICAATQFVTLVGFGLGLPFLPMYVQALGVTERSEVAIWSGVLSGSAALTMAVLAPIWGLLSDRYGRKPMLIR